MTQHILWIHGWGMSQHVWGDVDSLLPGCDHHFFTYQNCNTIEEMRQAIERYLSKPFAKAETTLCPPNHWIIIGWSMGGMLALEQLFANAKSPQGQTNYILDAVVVIAGTLRFVNTNRQLGWPLRVLERMQKQLRLNPEETLRQFVLSMFSEAETADPGLAEEIAKIHSQQTDFTLAGLDEGLAYLRNTDLMEEWDCRHSRMPAIFWMHGAADPINPPGAVPQLEDEEIVMLSDAGHAPFVTQQTEFYRQLRSFLHEHQ